MTSNDVSEQFYSSVIPSSFYLGGIKIKIEIEPEQATPLGKYARIVNHNDQVISLCPKSTSRQKIEQDFFRELTRKILHMQGRNDLVNDDSFLATFACLLHQASVTSKGWTDPFLYLIPELADNCSENASEENYDCIDSCGDIDDFDDDSRQDEYQYFADIDEEEREHQEACREHFFEFF